MNTAVCMDCELERAKVVKHKEWDSMHSHDHLLLRISDSAEVHSREVNNVRLQRELINITTDLKNLKQKVTTHLREASKVNIVLQQLKVDGEARVLTEHLANGAPALNGKMAIAPQEDDDSSDILGSTSSSETESIVGASVPNSPHPANPQTLSLDAGAETGGATGAAEAVATDPEPVDHEVPVALLQVVDGTLMNTPRPASAPFFAPFTAEPVPSATLRNGRDTTEMSSKHTAAPGQEPEMAPLEHSQSPRRSGSRQLSNHLVSIDAHVSSHDIRFSSLDTRISSLDTRIFSLDNRLSGMENQLGQILSLLSQSRS